MRAKRSWWLGGVVVVAVVVGTSRDAWAQVKNESQKLKPVAGVASDYFGRSISVSGEWMVVGAEQFVHGFPNPGTAFVFRKQINGTWAESQTLAPPGLAAGDFFGWSVSISGDWIAVGAYASDINGQDAGCVYMFELQGGSWVPTAAPLIAGGGAPLDYLGFSVSLSDDRLVAGAWGDDDPALGLIGADIGSAYVFERQSNGTWIEVAKLTDANGAQEDRFGESVSTDGDFIVVGAFHDDLSPQQQNAGSATVFQRNGATWTAAQKLTASNASGGDIFGGKVTVSGDVIVVGAQNVDDPSIGSQVGAAYVFERSGCAWNEVVKLTASDGQAGDHFNHVELSNDLLAVGTPSEDDLGDNAGSAYVFQRKGKGCWEQIAKLLASDGVAKDDLGGTVFVSENHVFVGSSADDDNGVQSGSAYVFDMSACVTPSAIPDRILWTQNLNGPPKGIIHGGDLPFAGVEQILVDPTGGSPSPTLSGVDVDVIGGWIYWSRSDVIKRASFSDPSTHFDVVTGFTGMHDVALDVMNGRIYWVEGHTIPSAGIYCADLGLSLPITKAQSQLLVTHPAISHLELDVAKGHVYYEYRDNVIAANGNTFIARMNTDGSLRMDLVSEPMGAFLGTQLDLAKNRMYWTDVVKKRIEGADLDGSNRQVLITSATLATDGLPIADPYSLALDTHRCDLYLRNIGTNIYRMSLCSSDPVIEPVWPDTATGPMKFLPGCEAAYSTTYGTGCPGSGSVIPSLTLGSPPKLGSTVHLNITNVWNANAPSALLVGFSKASIPRYGCVGLVDAFPPLSPLFVLQSGVTSIGPLTLPKNPALCGSKAYAQVLEQEPNVPSNVAFSPGLEIIFGY